MRYINLKNLGLMAIFLLPLYMVRFDLFGFPENTLEMLMVFFILFAFSYSGVRKELMMMARENKKYWLPALLIIVGFLLSALGSEDRYPGLGIIKSWLAIPLVFSFVLDAVFNKDGRKIIWETYFASSVLVALIGLGYAVFGRLTYDSRLSAIFNSPNYLAMYVVPGIITGVISVIYHSNNRLCFWRAEVQSSKLKAQNHNSKLKTILIFLGTVIMSLALYLTYSYTAWFSLLVALVIILIISKDISIKMLALFLFTAFLLFLSQLQNDKFADLINFHGRSSLASRMMIWRSALDIGRDHWFFGIGAGNFQEMYLGYQKFYLPYLEWAVPHPHSFYLTFWLYGGVFGAAGFVATLFFFFKDITAKISADRENRSYYLASFGIMFYVLIHGIVDTTYFKNDLAVVFWLSFLAVWSKKDVYSSQRKK